MIVFEDVTKVYDPDVVGLEDFTCHIGKGEFVFLVGPSGSGKSTLIKLILKELRPETNPFLRHCDFRLFLLERGGEAVGWGG